MTVCPWNWHLWSAHPTQQTTPLLSGGGAGARAAAGRSTAAGPPAAPAWVAGFLAAPAPSFPDNGPGGAVGLSGESGSAQGVLTLLSRQAPRQPLGRSRKGLSAVNFKEKLRQRPVFRRSSREHGLGWVAAQLHWAAGPWGRPRRSANPGSFPLPGAGPARPGLAGLQHMCPLG